MNQILREGVTIYMILYSRVLKLSNEPVASIAAVHKNCHKFFYFCKSQIRKFLQNSAKLCL